MWQLSTSFLFSFKQRILSPPLCFFIFSIACAEVKFCAYKLLATIRSNIKESTYTQKRQPVQTNYNVFCIDSSIEIEK